MGSSSSGFNTESPFNMPFRQFHLQDNMADLALSYTSERTAHPEQPVNCQTTPLGPDNTPVEARPPMG
ncbi:hypothetical protein CDV31_017085 [Fusarium ambrosium]|uniref:Uncharacterized protein n=1 Tax=Fusarium ambrosium TaxID=131363 RepID=A0A428RTL8_9HYPO|nr:hypothetical protein CDV31_017085 [Fusarium ambrosium]